MRIRLAAAAVAAGLLVGGCFSDSSSSNNPGIGPTNPATGNGSGSIPATPAGVGAFKALFVAGSGILPYPTDLYFNGSNDGTLNIPASTVFPNRVVMNQLDGFSTTASSYFRMSQAVRNDAAMLASSIRVIETVMARDPASGVYAPVGVGPRALLAPGVDYDVRLAPEGDAGGAVIEIVWRRPLSASTGTGTGIGYVVLVTNGVQNTSNVAATPDTDYLTARTEAIAQIGAGVTTPTCPAITNATLNAICRITFAHLRIGANPAFGPFAVSPGNVILSYSFTTQSTRDSLVAIAAAATPRPMTVVPTGQRTSAFIPSLPGIANVLAGSLQIPYYMTPPSPTDPTGPLTRAWTAAGASAVAGISATNRDITRFNPIPATVATLNIPMLITVPNGFSPSGGVKPTAGWPVVVFMHGLQGDRSQALAIADAYASQGFVVVAIDQVLHGIVNNPASPNPLYASGTNPLYPAGTRERTFDVDYLNNTTGAPGPDGRVDGSGASAINLSNPLVSRDGLRQLGADVIVLTKSLAAGNLDLDGVAGGDIDPTRIHYAGISLGAIAGAACVCTDVRSYYLNVPGGPLPNILRTAPAFVNTINAGLAAANPLLVPGTSLYAQFFRELQAAFDAGDPSNYLRQLVQDRPVLLTKVINDKVVPNGTNDYLINLTAATRASTAGPQAIAAGAPRFVTFLSGQSATAPDAAGLGPTHGSLLSPFGSLAATQEMQQHAVSLAASGGTAFVVGNASLLQP